MKLNRFFEIIKANRRRSAQEQRDEEWSVVLKRVRELLEIRQPEPVEYCQSESDQGDTDQIKFGT